MIQIIIGKKKQLLSRYEAFKLLEEGKGTEEGIKMYTQDLFFFEKIRPLGYKCAVDTRVKIGHLDVKSGIIY